MHSVLLYDVVCIQHTQTGMTSMRTNNIINSLYGHKVNHLIHSSFNTHFLCKRFSYFLQHNRLINTKHHDQLHDLVSPPHPKSNLRLIKWTPSPGESIIEKQFRNQLIELQNWNQNYWELNNTQFQKEKTDYIKNVLNKTPSEVTHNELALFYKKFLDANHKKHINYNFEWYKHHLKMLWPALLVTIVRMKRKLIR